MRAIVLTLLLNACAAMPDEVSASGYSSRYDFLSGTSLKEGGSDTGEEAGVIVTATYKLKPQSIRIVEPIRVVGQSPASLPKPEVDVEDSHLENLGSRVVGKLNNEVGNVIDNLIDDSIADVKEFGWTGKLIKSLGDYVWLIDAVVVMMMVLCLFAAFNIIRGRR